VRTSCHAASTVTVPKRKVVLIVLEGLGIVELPDAASYGDKGAHMLQHIAAACRLSVPNLISLGLGNIAFSPDVETYASPRAYYGRMREASAGKDSTTGHPGIAGLITQTPFPVYPNGFSPDVLQRFLEATGAKRHLGNGAAWGTVIIQELGDEHVRTGRPACGGQADHLHVGGLGVPDRRS